MTWEIVVGLGVLAAFVAIFVRVAIIYEKGNGELRVEISKLSSNIEHMNEINKEAKQSTDNHRKTIYGKLEKHDDKLNDHEQRITFLEK